MIVFEKVVMILMDCSGYVEVVIVNFEVVIVIFEIGGVVFEFIELLVSEEV